MHVYCLLTAFYIYFYLSFHNTPLERVALCESAVLLNCIQFPIRNQQNKSTKYVFTEFNVNIPSMCFVRHIYVLLFTFYMYILFFFLTNIRKKGCLAAHVNFKHHLILPLIISINIKNNHNFNPISKIITTHSDISASSDREKISR